MRAFDVLQQAGLVHAAAEPGRVMDPSIIPWTKIAVDLHKTYPDRFKLTKGADGIAEVTDTAGYIDVQRHSDHFSLYANGKAAICTQLAINYADPAALRKTAAFLKVQDAAARLIKAGSDAMKGPFAEILALLPDVAAPGNTVKKSVDAFRRRINKGFTESGSHMSDPAL